MHRVPPLLHLLLVLLAACVHLSTSESASRHQQHYWPRTITDSKIIYDEEIDSGRLRQALQEAEQIDDGRLSSALQEEILDRGRLVQTLQEGEDGIDISLQETDNIDGTRPSNPSQETEAIDGIQLSNTLEETVDIDSARLRHALQELLELNDGELRALMTGMSPRQMAPRITPSTAFVLTNSRQYLERLNTILSNVEDETSVVRRSTWNPKIARRRKKARQHRQNAPQKASRSVHHNRRNAFQQDSSISHRNGNGAFQPYSSILRQNHDSFLSSSSISRRNHMNAFQEPASTDYVNGIPAEEEADSILGALTELSAYLSGSDPWNSGDQGETIRERKRSTTHHSRGSNKLQHTRDRHASKQYERHHYLYYLRSEECPTSGGIPKMFCPSPSIMEEWRCVDEMELCDGKAQCPNEEDEAPTHCLFFKAMRSHVDELTRYLLRSQHS